jgi:hypothetical protein
MNTKIVLASFIAALSGFAGLATTAKADTDFRINLGLPGLPSLPGLPRLPTPPVVVISGRDRDVPAYGYDRGYDSHDRRDHGPRGYWKEIEIKTWVPARWVVSHDRRGREFRTLENGYFTYRTDRVWVSNDHDAGGFGRR